MIARSKMTVSIENIPTVHRQKEQQLGLCEHNHDLTRELHAKSTVDAIDQEKILVGILRYM